MRILIVGSDANAYSIAKSLKNNEHVDIVFVTSCSGKIEEFAENTNISETNNAELLDFVIANDIALTIVTSISAISNNIGEFFNEARRLILAPSSDAAHIALFKSSAKKTMYRLKIPTMKFGVFERENQAIDYVSAARRPLAIKTDVHIPGEYPVFAESFTKAKNILEKLFISPENKVVIEDYLDAKEVSMYFLTDGYTALPIGNCASNDLLFSYPDSVISPDNYVSDELESKIMKEVVYPVIDDISTKGQPYCGILGVDIFLSGDNYNVIEFNPFFKQMHLQTILPLIKSDLCDLFLSAASGSLSDEYQYIKMYNYSAVSEIKPQNKIDENEQCDDENLHIAYTSSSKIIFTQTARTLTRAKQELKENIEYLTKIGE